MKIVLLIVSLAISGITAARPRRSVGGTIIPIENAPYFVSITEFGEYIRGGVLISSKHVLSAARFTEHLLPSDVKVVTGIDSRGAEGTSHEVRNIFRPMQYISTLSAADSRDNIAILILSSPIKIGDKQRPIGLPNEEPSYWKTASLVAFGTSGNLPRAGDRLHLLKTKIAPIEYCIGDDPVALASHSAIFCARNNPDRRMTTGDAGSPLVLNEVLIGIASWSDQQGRNFEYYTNVYKYLPFIERTTGCRGSKCVIA